jgi:acyl carrier protein
LKEEEPMGNAALNPSDIKSSLRAFLSEPILPLARVSAFGDDDSFLERGILDSTGVLELVSHIENTFGVRVEADEIIPENLDSLNKLASFVLRKAAPVA